MFYRQPGNGGDEPRSDARELRVGYRRQGLNWERTYWSPVLEMKGDTFERLDPDLFGTVRLR
jgi:hypothetical protein